MNPEDQPKHPALWIKQLLGSWQTTIVELAGPQTISCSNKSLYISIYLYSICVCVHVSVHR